MGQPYGYDADGLPAAQGDPDIVWDLGKIVDASLVNAPVGMALELDTGRMIWTPAPGQEGEHRVTLVARNSAGRDVQEFVIAVQPAARAVKPAVAHGCGCGPSTTDATALGLLLIIMLRRARPFG